MKSRLTLLLGLVLLCFGHGFAQFTLTLNLTGMDPHIGQRFEVRIIDKADSAEVGRQIVPEITSAAFTLPFVVMHAGHSYNVDFYADANGNGVYDAPPEDHAWRRMVMNVSEDVTVDFIHGTSFTDIGIEEDPELGYYNAVWGGRWMNLTFGSTDTIQVMSQVGCDSVHLSMTTSGLFGNPDTVIFNFADTVPSTTDLANDTIRLQLDAPLSGEVVLTNGMITGDLTDPGTGFGLQFNGNYGRHQSMFLYTVIAAGNPFANGYTYLHEEEVLGTAPLLILVHDSQTDATCAGQADGAAMVHAEGGTAPYTFTWSDGGTSATRTDLIAGTNLAIATDVHGCMDSVTIVIGEPDALTMTTQVNDVSCSGLSDGSITVFVIGGTAPYQYMWSNGSAAGETIDGLPAGIYCITVSDASACTIDTCVMINEPTPNLLNVSASPEMLCTGDTALLTAMPISGQMPFTFLWSTGATTESILVTAGTYSITVTDNSECSAEGALTLSEDSPTIDDILVTDATGGNSNGSIEVNASGGYGVLSYSLDGVTYSASPIFTGLPPGDYCVFVQDEAGCVEKSEVITIDNVTSLDDPTRQFRISPNPATDYVQIAADFSWKLKIIDSRGRTVGQLDSGMNEVVSLQGFAPGLYLFVLSDETSTRTEKIVVERK